ncbi:hypothetical protein QTQ03_03440 [Micromonospora sp. WMMA1363]|uniref:hypothetical protein n=1 Tax=Micromonospora sp. WMMA1363 TaxID=3053985 RepID=UPI00259D0E01|nr:hypothetical protein [Micromonospora sp. WMMA1363]MDM4718693.1 hypothetical protein [Micromonospora sp. WMMA1363]
MTVFIQNDAIGAGAGTIQPDLAAVHLLVIANLDTGFGLGATTGNLQEVIYTRTDPGIPPTRLDTLVNTDFGINPAGVDIIVLAVGGNFTLNDGTLITNRGGTALSPAGSGMPGSTLNGTTSCLVIYDTSDNNGNGYCLAREGTGGTLDLRLPVSVMTYHELSHALRIVTDSLLELTATCDPASPEENTAITDENDMRTQLATLLGDPVVLRDPNIHCGTSCGGGGGGSCCIVASVTSGSPLSAEVAALRSLRDGFLRRSESGFAFFEALHHAYYAFSPQVVTSMAADLQLRAVTLDGFVRPLIRMLQLTHDYAVDGVDPVELGRRYLDGLGTAEQIQATQAVGERVEKIVRGGDPAELSPTEQRVASLLVGHALPDPHIRWALIEPVRSYHRLLPDALAGEQSPQLGRRLTTMIVDWAGRLPVDPCWGSMDLPTARAELEMLTGTMLRDGGARRHFLHRLAAEYGSTTAVRTAVTECLEGAR